MPEPGSTRLSVNLNKVALLRNQRDIGYPDVVEMARIIVAAGADGLTVHPRPDQRHVRTGDVLALRRLIDEELGRRVEFNVEGYPSEDFLELIGQVRPDQVTLVPDAPGQATSDHGWDVAGEGARLGRIVERLKGDGARVSLFMDPEAGAMAGAAATGADRIELYTGPYAFAFGTDEGEVLLRSYIDAAGAAAATGLGVNAGHDLNLDNLPPFRRAIPNLTEVSIGHAITADALKIGFPAAVEAYLRALGRAPFAS